MGSPNDKPFIGCESRLNKLSIHMKHASRNIVEWYGFAREFAPTFSPEKTIDLLSSFV
jgi:hypothetical protein